MQHRSTAHRLICLSARIQRLQAFNEFARNNDDRENPLWTGTKMVGGVAAGGALGHATGAFGQIAREIPGLKRQFPNGMYKKNIPYALAPHRARVAKAGKWGAAIGAGLAGAYLVTRKRSQD